MTIEKLKTKYDLTNEDIVKVIREKYPMFNKSTLSMAMHPDKYGVKLLPKCSRELTERYVPPKPKAEKPTKHKVTVTLDDEVYDKLITGRLSRGLSLSQYIELILTEAINDRT